MSLDDGTDLADLDANNDAIVVVINGSGEEQSHTVATASGFELHSVQQNSVDTTVQGASFSEGTDEGTFTVPALTTAVFVKPQAGAQGSGLAAGVTRDKPDEAPYGDTELYLNAADGFDADNSFSYAGNGVYTLDTELAAGVQRFTISSEDGLEVNLGFGDVTIGGNSVEVTNDNGSFVLNVEAEGSFTFTLDASSDMPVLTISSVSLTVNCSALVDSTDPTPFAVATANGVGSVESTNALQLTVRETLLMVNTGMSLDASRVKVKLPSASTLRTKLPLSLVTSTELPPIVTSPKPKFTSRPSSELIVKR